MCLIRTHGFGTNKCAPLFPLGFEAARDGAYKVYACSPLLARRMLWKPCTTLLESMFTRRCWLR
jgi:hypothetical protein